MEPFLVIGEILKEKEHQIVCSFPDQFRNLVEDSDIKFATLGAEYIELLDSDAGKAAYSSGYFLPSTLLHRFLLVWLL